MSKIPVALVSVFGLGAVGALAIGGCATATSDENLKPAAGDASIPGRADAGPEQGIRPDAGPVPTSADAAPVPAAADASPNCVPTPVNVLANGDFDQGPAVWIENSGGTPTPYPLIVSDAEVGISADSGTFLTWLGGYSAAGAIDTFYQDVTLPGDATPVTLSGKIWIDTAEDLVFAWDTLNLAVVDPNTNAVLEDVATWSNIDGGTGWTNLSATLTNSFAGQSVRLRFRAELDASNNTSFLLDTLSFNTTSCQ